MGQHSARRSGGAMTSVAGRGLFTATAAVALLGGGASMAFAGEAPSSGGHEQSHSHGENAEHSQGESESCDIPVVDDTTKSGEATVNAVTGDATAGVFEAGGQATQPVHDAVCPPANELLGSVLGGAQPSADGEEATSEEEGSSRESSEGAGTDAPTSLPIQ